MAFKMSDEQCARCPRMLANGNSNKDRLCGHCQRDLNTHMPKPSRAYLQWLEDGKPRINRKPETKRPTLNVPSGKRIQYTGRRIPDPATVPTSYLVACFKELTRRTEEAEQLMAVRKMLRLPSKE